MIECEHYCVECDANWFHQVEVEELMCSGEFENLLCDFHREGDLQKVVTTEVLHEHLCDKQGHIWEHRKEICAGTWEWSCPEHE